jgi:predicted nucleic acid-binding protein
LAIQSVYVETTVFSFYYDQRQAPAIIAMRDWTRRWWDNHRQDYMLLTSTAVLDELEGGNLPHRHNALALALTVPSVAIEESVREIARVYIKHRVMPNNPLGDALHLALASFYKIDYLVTWNCEHLANANKSAHVRRVNAWLGLPVPGLVTPMQLIGGE